MQHRLITGIIGLFVCAGTLCAQPAPPVRPHLFMWPQSVNVSGAISPDPASAIPIVRDDRNTGENHGTVYTPAQAAEFAYNELRAADIGDWISRDHVALFPRYIGADLFVADAPSPAPYHPDVDPRTARGATPVGGGMARPSRDATPGAGSNCWVTEQRDPLGTLCNMKDDVDSDGLGVAVRSPDLASIPDSSSVLVELSLWYGSADGANTAGCVGYASSDSDVECVLEWIANDPSGTATVLGSRSFTPSQAAFRWQTVRFTSPTGTGEHSHIRVRFIDPAPDSIVEGGVDDVRVWTIVSCEECCDGDINADGNVDQDDVSYLTTVIGGGPDPVGIDPDFNRDGNADQDDIIALINKVGGGPCP